MRYQEPDFLTRALVNPAVAFFTGTLGLSLRGSRILAVRRENGARPRSTR